MYTIAGYGEGPPAAVSLMMIDSCSDWESLPEATAPVHLTFPGKQPHCSVHVCATSHEQIDVSAYA